LSHAPRPKDFFFFLVQFTAKLRGKYKISHMHAACPHTYIHSFNINNLEWIFVIIDKPTVKVYLGLLTGLYILCIMYNDMFPPL
jgi:hypothetical protein